MQPAEKKFGVFLDLKFEDSRVLKSETRCSEKKISGGHENGA